MGGFQVQVMTVGGVEKEYFIPINDATGDNGLLDDDANVQALEHYVGGELKAYWWSHASGTGTIIGESEIFTANTITDSVANHGAIASGYNMTYLNSDFTMNVWIWIPDLVQSAGEVLWIEGDGGGHALRLLQFDTRVFFSAFNNATDNWQSVTSGTDMVVGWNMISVVADVTDVSIYVNSVFCASIPRYTVKIKTSSSFETVRGSANAMSKHSLFITEEALSVAQLELLYNDAQPKCYDRIDSGIKGSEQMFIPLYNYTGFESQELDDLTGNGFNFSEVGTITYDGSADIECEASEPSVGIEWTQSFSVDSTDVSDDVIYGVNPAIESWKDKGTSGVNLTQTVSEGQPDLVIGGTPADNYLEFDTVDRMDNLTAFNGDFSYFFHINTLVDALGRRLLDDPSAGTTPSGIVILPTTSGSHFRIKSLEGDNNDFNNYTWTTGFHKILITRQGLVAKLYVDGVLEDTINNLVGTIGGYTSVGFDNNSGSIEGKLKTFKAIDRALTDQEAIDETS